LATLSHFSRIAPGSKASQSGGAVSKKVFRELRTYTSFLAEAYPQDAAVREIAAKVA
jgi:hypothetical protein